MIKAAGLSQAMQAYQAAQNRLDPATKAGSGQIAGTGGFDQFLKNEIGEAAMKLDSSERTATAALTGKADLQQVVEAVTAAELGLQKVTAVRDRVISAYQEILRMPI